MFLNLLLQAAADPIPAWQGVIVDILTVLGGGAVVSFVTWGVRKVIPKIPRFMLPIVSMVLAWLGTWVGSLLTGGTLNPILVAALGAAAVWIREIKSTIEEHGTEA